MKIQRMNDYSYRRRTYKMILDEEEIDINAGETKEIDIKNHNEFYVKLNFYRTKTIPLSKDNENDTYIIHTVNHLFFFIPYIIIIFIVRLISNLYDYQNDLLVVTFVFLILYLLDTYLLRYHHIIIKKQDENHNT